MSDAAEVETYVASLKVVELKDELKKRHLSYVGNKQALAQRLREDMIKSLQEKTTTESVEEEEEEEEEEVEEGAPEEEKEDEAEPESEPVEEESEEPATATATAEVTRCFELRS